MEFWKAVGKKIVEMMISAKILVIIAVLTIGTFMVYDKLMTGAVFAGMVGGIISTVFALREAFKVAKVKSDDDSDDLKP